MVRGTKSVRRSVEIKSRFLCGLGVAQRAKQTERRWNCPRCVMVQAAGQEVQRLAQPGRKSLSVKCPYRRAPLATRSFVPRLRARPPLRSFDDSGLLVCNTPLVLRADARQAQHIGTRSEKRTTFNSNRGLGRDSSSVADHSSPQHGRRAECLQTTLPTGVARWTTLADYAGLIRTGVHSRGGSAPRDRRAQSHTHRQTRSQHGAAAHTARRRRPRRRRDARAPLAKLRGRSPTNRRRWHGGDSTGGSRGRRRRRQQGQEWWHFWRVERWRRSCRRRRRRALGHDADGAETRELRLGAAETMGRGAGDGGGHGWRGQGRQLR